MHARTNRIAFGLMLMALLLMAMRAYSQPVTDYQLSAAPTRLELEQMRLPVVAGNSTEATTQTLLWARRDRLMVGVGFEQRPLGLAPAGIVGTGYVRNDFVVGLGWATGARSRLTWELPVGNDSNNLAINGARTEREMRVGLTFEGRNALGDLPRGTLLKMQLSGQTALALRPRHGRLNVTLHSRW